MSLSAVNPELRESLQRMPTIENASEKTLAEIRASINSSSEILDGRPLPDVSVKEVSYPSANGPDVRVITYEPKDSSGGARPAIVYFHGGGMLAGEPLMDDPKCHRLVSDLGVKIFSVDYRLAPETPFPGPLEDSYAVLSYVFEHAEALGVDVRKIAVGGESAGGNLAAAVSLLARDRKEYAIAFQLLIYPWVNDRTSFTQDPGAAFGQFRWTRGADRFAWRCYVGDKAGGDSTSGYAAPLRAKDVSNLPPAFIGVGALDLFLRDDLAYAERLMTQQVSVEVDVVPGAYHAFDNFNPDAELTRRFYSNYCAALARALDL